MKELEDINTTRLQKLWGAQWHVMSRLFYARKKLQKLLRDVYENV